VVWDPLGVGEGGIGKEGKERRGKGREGGKGKWTLSPLNLKLKLRP